MPYRNKTYVAFDGDTDITYYYLMLAWRTNDNMDFNFHNAYDLNSARDSSKEESIKAQLRERMNNTKIFVLLVGKNTRYCTKFVKWEIETALRKEIPIIVVNLNGKRHKDSLCPSILDNELTLHVSFNMKIIRYAIDNWTSSYFSHKTANEISSYYYKESTYERLGL